MPTYSDRVVKSVTHYQPGPLPLNNEDLGVYVVDELKKFSDDSTDRLYDIVSGHWKYIDYLVQEIFDATITP